MMDGFIAQSNVILYAIDSYVYTFASHIFVMLKLKPRPGTYAMPLSSFPIHYFLCNGVLPCRPE